MKRIRMNMPVSVYPDGLHSALTGHGVATGVVRHLMAMLSVYAQREYKPGENLDVFLAGLEIVPKTTMERLSDLVVVKEQQLLQAQASTAAAVRTAKNLVEAISKPNNLEEVTKLITEINAYEQ